MPPGSQKNNDENPRSGWAEYRLLVVNEIERISKELTRTTELIATIQMSSAQAINDLKLTLVQKIQDSHDKSNQEIITQISEIDKDIAIKFKNIEQQLISDVKILRESVDSVTKDVVMIKTKAAFIGALAGFLVALAGVVVSIVLKE